MVGVQSDDADDFDASTLRKPCFFSTEQQTEVLAVEVFGTDATGGEAFLRFRSQLVEVKWVGKPSADEGVAPPSVLRQFSAW